MNQTAQSAAALPTTKSSTHYLPAVARVLMGLIFFIFGLNGFLHFIPPPKTPLPEGAMSFVMALVQTGYMMPLVTGTQLLVGVLLLLNRFVPLALALIAPIIVGIITFHIFLAPANMAPAIAVLVLEFYLAWSYRGAFRPMVSARVQPG
jgi:uncharacterized membrane protein YphA (DoxX/SURF4 family)